MHHPFLFVLDLSKTCVSVPLGMASGTIPDSSITASSYQTRPHYTDFDRKPEYARLGHTKFWGSTDSEPWIQVNLGSMSIIKGLQTEGNYKDETAQYWVEQVKVKIGMDEGDLTFIEDDQGQHKVTKSTTYVIYFDITHRVSKHDVPSRANPILYALYAVKWRTTPKHQNVVENIDTNRYRN